MLIQIKNLRSGFIRALLCSLIFVLSLSLTGFENTNALASDKTPPRIPQEFNVKSLDQSLEVSLRDGAEEDIFSYIIYIRSDDGDLPPVYMGRNTTQMINSLVNGRTYFLSVVARDMSGNESAKTHEIAIAPSPSSTGGDFHVSAWMPPAGWEDNDGYYSFTSNIDVFNSIKPFWYNAEGDGTLAKKGDIPDANLINTAHEHGVKVVPAITNNFDENDKISNLLKDGDRIDFHVQTIVNEVVGHGYDGIDIDYENLQPEVKNQYTDFAERLASALHEQGKILSITVQAKKSDSDSWRGAGATDFVRLGIAADQFVIMTYDYHRLNTSPGAIAPVDWMTDVLEYAKYKVPHDKIIAGVPFYGYDWCVSYKDGGCDSKGLLWEGVQNVINQYNPPLEWDDRGQTPWFFYTDNSGFNRVVHYEDHRSIASKVELVRSMGLQGISIWRLGSEDPENLNVVRGQLGKEKISPPGIRIAPGDGSIGISWDELARPEVTGYRIYQKDVFGEEVKIDVTGDIRSYHLVEGVKNGKTYAIHLAALKDGGEEYSKSSQILVTPQDLYYPGRVEDIKVQRVGETTIDIAFIPSGDEYFFGQAKTLDLRYSKENITSENFEAAEKYLHLPELMPVGQRQSWQLMDLEPGTEYYIAMKIVDESGNKSDVSTVVRAETFDTVPPVVPADVRMEARDGEISISWVPNTEKDLAGYRIYYKQEDSYYNVIDLNAEAIGHILKDLKNGKNYSLSMTAVDVRGNESERTEEVAVKPSAGSLANRVSNFFTEPVDKLKASLRNAGSKLAASAAIPYLVVLAVFIINFFVYRGLKVEIHKSKSRREENYLLATSKQKKKRIMKF